MEPFLNMFNLRTELPKLQFLRMLVLCLYLVCFTCSGLKMCNSYVIIPYNAAEVLLMIFRRFVTIFSSSQHNFIGYYQFCECDMQYNLGIFFITVSG